MYHIVNEKASISILYDMLGLKIFSYSIFSNNWKHKVYIKVRWLETRKRHFCGDQ